MTREQTKQAASISTRTEREKNRNKIGKLIRIRLLLLHGADKI